VFARAGKTDPPSRFILSQTSAWKGLAYLVSRSPSDAGRLCGLRIDSGDRARLEVSTARQNAPSDAGKLVGESDRKHVVMQPLLRRLDPGLQPVAQQLP
jgi:hypothetical protein